MTDTHQEGYTMSDEERMRLFALYRALMEEVKVRLDAIGYASAAKAGIPRAMIREFCFLQLRMVCELIALACLAAHGDIQGTTGLRKKYAADEIIKKLESLHPNFYPLPVRLGGGRSQVRHATPIEAGFLTKGGLLSLYGRCGGVLHRGTLKKLLSGEAQPKVDLRDLAAWREQIAVLLGIHFIQLHNGERMVCILRDVDDGNRTQVTLASPNPPPQSST
jgi:hypothetical protein